MLRTIPHAPFPLNATPRRFLQKSLAGQPSSDYLALSSSHTDSSPKLHETSRSANHLLGVYAHKTAAFGGSNLTLHSPRCKHACVDAEACEQACYVVPLDHTHKRCASHGTLPQAAYTGCSCPCWVASTPEHRSLNSHNSFESRSLEIVSLLGLPLLAECPKSQYSVVGGAGTKRTPIRRCRCLSRVMCITWWDKV